MNSRFSILRRSLPTLAILALAAPVFAHTGPAHTHGAGFAAGFTHPLAGWDHILAMVAVGLWAAQRGGNSRWLLPASFVLVMSIGAMAGIMGAPVPFVETGISASILILGLLVATAVRLPMAGAVALTGLFAFFHGHAHGTELSAGLSAAQFVAGFGVATALLHGAGIASGLAINSLGKNEMVRGQMLKASGALVTAAGVLVIAGVL